MLCYLVEVIQFKQFLNWNQEKWGIDDGEVKGNETTEVA